MLGLPGGVAAGRHAHGPAHQLLARGIGLVDAVLYTHEHADHVFGLDDVRLFPYYLGHKLPLYCEPVVERRIRKSFDYAFGQPEAYHAGGIPQLEIHGITTAPFDLLGTRIIPIRLLHGRWEVLGFRFGNVAYCTTRTKSRTRAGPFWKGWMC